MIRYEPDTVVRFWRVLDLRDMCRVLDALLPPEITERAGIGGGREDEDDSPGED